MKFRLEQCLWTTVRWKCIHPVCFFVFLFYCISTWKPLIRPTSDLLFETFKTPLSQFLIWFYMNFGFTWNKAVFYFFLKLISCFRSILLIIVLQEGEFQSQTSVRPKQVLLQNFRVPADGKNFHSMTRPPSCFTVGMLFLWTCEFERSLMPISSVLARYQNTFSILPLQNRNCNWITGCNWWHQNYTYLHLFYSFRIFFKLF